jgi:hypothetical protein
MKNLLSIIFILVCGLSVFGQNFSADWQKVPVGFQGDDVEKIYKILSESSNLKEKSEFETTSDYQKRVTDLSKMALPGKSADSILAFVYRPEKYVGRVTAKYDADTQNLQVSILTRSVSYLDRTPKREFVDIIGVAAKDARLKSLGSYEGENAYGVKRTIEKSLMEYFTIGINNMASFRKFHSSGYESGFKLLLPVPPAKAKDIKENLAVLYVGTLVPPFTALDGTVLEPTIDKPRRVSIGNYILTMNLSEIWIYNNLTGEVISKIKSK